MNSKMKSCFTPHALMHSLFGLGLGLLLTVIFPGLSNFWLAVIVMVAAFVLDYMRKDTK